MSNSEFEKSDLSPGLSTEGQPVASDAVRSSADDATEHAKCIEQYMKQLLGKSDDDDSGSTSRLNTSTQNPQTLSPQTSTASTDDSVSQIPQTSQSLSPSISSSSEYLQGIEPPSSSVDREPSVAAQDEPASKPRGSVPPESSSDISRMREVAINSTRGALDRYSRGGLVSQGFTQMIAATLAIGTAFYLFHKFHSRDSTMFLIGLAVTAVAAWLTYQFHKTTTQLSAIEQRARQNECKEQADKQPS